MLTHDVMYGLVPLWLGNWTSDWQTVSSIPCFRARPWKSHSPMSPRIRIWYQQKSGGKQANHASVGSRFTNKYISRCNM